MASLYLHIPFCEHKCIYCDFYSIEARDPLEAFLKALQKEIRLYAELGKGERFETIFLGGGTPSILAPATIREILDLLAATFTIEPDAEITLEANPGTVERNALKGFLDAGINRMSFGVQSFFDEDLRFLTRIHTAAEARQTISLARDLGLKNVSLDLIFALPGQTLSRWESNLREACALSTDHVSAYSLIVEPGTPLERMVTSGQVSALPLDTEAAFYEFTMAYLAAEGFQHYEVSNYARPGFRSRHNSNYWNHRNYLGFGPSAHSFWSNERWWNNANLRTYLDRLGKGQFPVAGREHLTRAQLVDEYVMLGLRCEGIDLHRLASDYGADLMKNSGTFVHEIVGEGLAILDGPMLRLTDKGFLLCDEVSGTILSRL